MKKSKRIKTQLLIVLSFFTFAGVCIAMVSLYYFRKVHDVYEVSSSAHNLYDRYVRTVNAEQKFVYIESAKTLFYETGNSPYLLDFKEQLAATRAELNHLKTRDAYPDFEIDNKVQLLSDELSKYETLFSFTVEKIRNRGFKDFGAEGKMRAFVHDLESHSKQIGLANVLMLRRHEKDFLLRNDDAYVKKLNDKIAYIKDRVWKNPRLQNAQKDTLLMLLQNYQYSFLELVKVTKEIGHKNEQGMSELLAQCNFMVDQQFSQIKEAIVKKEAALVSYIELVLMLVILNIVLASIFIIHLYTRKISVVATLVKGKEEITFEDKKYTLAESVKF